MAPSALQSGSLFVRMYGLSAQAREALNAALRCAIGSMHRTLYAPSRDELTTSELSLLEQAGVEVEESPRRADPMIAYAIEFAAILTTSLSPAQAGERLGGVTAVRARQMIRERSLYALRLEGRWKIPVFQFGDEGLVPNIDAVNAALPATLDAVSVLRWYTCPDRSWRLPEERSSLPSTGCGREWSRRRSPRLPGILDAFRSALTRGGVSS